MQKETRSDTKFRNQYDYGAMNRIKHTTGFLNEPMSYTPESNQHAMADANGRVYQTAYDDLNRKKHFGYPTEVTGQSRYESWRYDMAGGYV